MEPFYSGNSDIFKLEIDAQAKSSFLEMARWTKFLAILGFVLMGLTLLAGIAMAFLLTRFGESSGGASSLSGLGAAGPVYIIAAFVFGVSIYFYPTYALLRYSTCISRALNTDNKVLFNTAIKYLKNSFKYIGILTIILLVLYGLALGLNLADLSKLSNQ